MDCDAQALTSRLVSRRCLLLRLSEAGIDTIQNAAFHKIAGVVILLPSSSWSAELQSNFAALEHDLLTHEISIPVYFATENRNLTSIYRDLKDVDDTDLKSLTALLNTIMWSTGFRFVVHSSPPKPISDASIFNIEGRLGDSSRRLPFIVICAHYDSMSSIPSLSHGADANGSGVVVLLELARLFSRLYALYSGRSRYGFIFVLTGGGKYNFLGSKHWLEHGTEDFISSDFDSVSQVICLEGLGSRTYPSDLYMHMSRPPKDGSFSALFLQNINLAIRLHSVSNVGSEINESVNWVHKKINLKQEVLAWEHERFSIHRVPGLTLSSWPSVHIAHLHRRNSLDGGPLYRTAVHGRDDFTRSALHGNVDPKLISRKVLLLAEALVRMVFNDTGQSDLTADTPIISPDWVTETTVTPLLNLLTNHPRSTQLLNEHTKTQPKAKQRVAATERPDSSTLPRLIRSLEYILSESLQDVRISRYPLSTDTHTIKFGDKKTQTAETKENTENSTQTPVRSAPLSGSFASSDFHVILYSGMEPTFLTAYRLKSSFFELFVAIIIGIYLAFLFLFLENYSRFQQLLEHVLFPKQKVH